MFRGLLKARLRREAAKNKEAGATSKDFNRTNAVDKPEVVVNSEPVIVQSDPTTKPTSTLFTSDSKEELRSPGQEAEVKETDEEVRVGGAENEKSESTNKARSNETSSSTLAKRSPTHFGTSVEKRSKIVAESPLALISNINFSVPPPSLGTMAPNALNWPLGISVSAFDRVKRAVTPLADVAKEKQLELKQETVKRILADFKSEILLANGVVAAWFRSQERKLGHFLQVDKMQPSPRSDHYRNKCECTIGIDPDTNLLTVGFLLDPKKSEVGPIYHLRHIPVLIKSIVKCFEGFLRELRVAPFDPIRCCGHWISLSVRVSECGESMVVLAFDPRAMEQPRVKGIKERVAAFAKNGLGQSINLTSCYFKTRGSDRSSTLKLLHGEATIREKLSDRIFRISPRAYFPVNIEAAERCFQVVADCADLDFNWSLVDVCCGTGSIGLSLSGRCGQVIGLDALPEAIQDARVNAFNNDVTNCEFFSGSAEEYLGTLWRRLVFDRVVCVVDPPRAGIGSKVNNAIFPI
jgi:tRNA/tmRNA/rRNA uracil-C5-methylase (TrmA/RlmC/RlmD family)